VTSVGDACLYISIVREHRRCSHCCGFAALANCVVCVRLPHTASVTSGRPSVMLCAASECFQFAVDGSCSSSAPVLLWLHVLEAPEGHPDLWQ
jgi:hypothetical protein